MAGWRDRASKNGSVHDTVRAIERYDPDLIVVWNPLVPIRVAGVKKRFKARWSIYRKGHVVRYDLHDEPGVRFSGLARAWVPIMLLEEQDGAYRALDERVLYDLKRMDLRAKYDLDQKRLAVKLDAELEHETQVRKNKLEADFEEEVRDIAKEYHRELADGFEIEARRRGISL